eukprot:Blabericola_migrator_1__9299@NODE_4_length_29828_cov_96_571587_g3_i0_p19_GENE_NODE_4_length_29828_cov_96_571587_g3_i0NODE_4_length_29828_cov_96_571587_g3_i0_p19_ORF_typecomplete_len113_score8_33_NODE_4_length_29828_cov_96_571587_g3_i01351913857
MASLTACSVCLASPIGNETSDFTISSRTPSVVDFVCSVILEIRRSAGRSVPGRPSVAPCSGWLSSVDGDRCRRARLTRGAASSSVAVESVCRSSAPFAHDEVSSVGCTSLEI